MVSEKVRAADNTDHAYPLTGIGRALLALGRPHDAIAPLERALALRTRSPVSSARLSETRFALARARYEAGMERAAAMQLARDACDGFAASGKSSAKDHEMALRWMTRHASR